MPTNLILTAIFSNLKIYVIIKHAHLKVSLLILDIKESIP